MQGASQNRPMARREEVIVATEHPLRGNGDHEFRDIPPDDYGIDCECIYCGVRIKSKYGIAGAMMPCHEEQRSLAEGTEADACNDRPVII